MNKKTIIGTTMAFTLLLSGTAFALSYNSPADIVGGLTNIAPEQITEQRAEGKTYGQIASENGVLDQFKNEMVGYKNSVIDERVTNGSLTEEAADEFKKEIAERVADCDGTPDADRERLGQKYGGGMGFGQGNGDGTGMGQGLRNGTGRMNGGRMGAGRGFNK